MKIKSVTKEVADIVIDFYKICSRSKEYNEETDKQTDYISRKLRYMSEEEHMSLMKKYHKMKDMANKYNNRKIQYEKDNSSSIFVDDNRNLTAMVIGNPKDQSSWMVLYGSDSASNCLFYWTSYTSKVLVHDLSPVPEEQSLEEACKHG